MIHLHPNAALSISDCLNRLKYSKDNDAIGGFLGKLGKDDTSILYSFEIPSTEYLDFDLLSEHYKLLSQIYGNGYLEIVGFYSIGNVDNSTLLDIASNSTAASLKSAEPDNKVSILNIELNDFVLLELNATDIKLHEIDQSWKFKNLCSGVPISFDTKYTLSEQILMTTYNNIPQTTEFQSVDVVSSIKTSFSELSTKLHQAVLFLKNIENNVIDTENNLQNKLKFQSLSKLAHNIVMLEELVKEQKCITDQDINELIAIRSSYSSLMHGNL